MVVAQQRLSSGLLENERTGIRAQPGADLAERQGGLDTAIRDAPHGAAPTVMIGVLVADRA
jgi:hypothetical protein